MRSFYFIFIYLFLINFASSQNIVVETVAGTGVSGYANGSGQSAQFNAPQDIDFDVNGNIYVCDNGNGAIRKITPLNMVSTYAGTGIPGSQNGPVTQAQFNSPLGICILSNGDAYVSEYGHRIRKIANGMVTNYLGNGVAGGNNGIGAVVRFNVPTEIIAGTNNNLFILDRFNNKIREINLTNDSVSDYCGSGNSGWQDGPALTSKFDKPYDFCADNKGNIYVADRDNHLIRKIDPTGNVSTIAGSGVAGYMNGPGNTAMFNIPAGIAVDKKGNVYVGDRLNNVIRKIDTTNTVSTFAGNGSSGFTDGPIANATFNLPTKISIDTNNSILYISDVGNHAIRRIKLDSTLSYCDTLVIRDTITVLDTVFVTLLDTVLDTVFITVLDTVFVNVIDTVFIHDTIILYDTINVFGMMENASLESISAFPNPLIDDVLRIKYELKSDVSMIRFKVYDLSGRLILDKYFNDVRAGKNEERFIIPQYVQDGNLIINVELDDDESYTLKMQKITR